MNHLRLVSTLLGVPLGLAVGYALCVAVGLGLPHPLEAAGALALAYAVNFAWPPWNKEPPARGERCPDDDEAAG